MLTRIAWLLVAIWLLCALLIVPLDQVGVDGKYILAGAFIAASVGMGIYLCSKWQVLAKTERWGIILSIPVWLLLVYFFYR